MNKIKIAFIITRLCAGGAAHALANIAKHIDKNQYELTLLYGQLSDGEKDCHHLVLKYFDNSIQLKFTQREFSLLQDYKALKEVRKYLSEGNYDIVHTHTSKAGFIGRLAAFNEKVPAIVHSTHGIIFSKNADIPSVNFLKRNIFLFAEKRAAAWCQKIFTLSEKEIEEWVELKVGFKSLYQSLPSPVDCDKFLSFRDRRSQLRSEWQLSEENFVVVILARLAEEKGHKYLLEALNHTEGVSLLVVGDGPLREELNSFVEEKHLADRVSFLGHRDDVHEWLVLADTLVLASSYEGQGLVLIEAMAAGVPVIATDVGGVSEVVEDGVSGLIVDAKSPQALAKALSTLKANKALRRDLIKGGDQVILRYKPHMLVQRLESVYKELLKSS